MELLTFCSVLLGMVLAGFIADSGLIQTHVLSGAFIVLAIIGWWSSNRIKANEPVAKPKFEASINPVRFFARGWKAAGKTKGLRWTLAGLGVFWLLGSMLQMTLILHMPVAYGLSSSQTALVISAVAVGIGLGCWVSGIIVKNRIEQLASGIDSSGTLLQHQQQLKFPTR